MPRFDRDRLLLDWSARAATPLSAARREGVRFLLDSVEADAEFTMTREVAYFLATVQWETAGTFRPIREYRASQGANPRHFALQQRYWPSGYFGRGYVQLTWDYNYRLAGQKLRGETFVVAGAPLTVTARTFLEKPDLLLEPAISYRVAARGMREGWFTGKKLSQYITDGAPPDYVNARRVVNGIDHCQEIAALANAIELALRAAARTTPLPRVRRAPAVAHKRVPESAPTKRPASKRRTAKGPASKRAPARKRPTKRQVATLASQRPRE